MRPTRLGIAILLLIVLAVVARLTAGSGMHAPAARGEPSASSR